MKNSICLALLFVVFSVAPVLSWVITSDSMLGAKGKGGGGAGTFACNIGPSFTGSVPAGAAAAGFNTCAANYDFTTLGALSNWLDCAGAPSPILWNIPGAGGGNGSSCSVYSMVTDGGSPALLITLPSGTVGPKYAVFQTVDQNTTVGQLFPQTTYIEMSYRVGTNSEAICTGGALCDMMQFFTYTTPGGGAGGPWFEWDYMEVYTGAGNPTPSGATAIHTLSNSAHPSATAGCVAEFNIGGTNTNSCYTVNLVADQTAWHTYAERIVSDGAADLLNTVTGNMTWCVYLDGTQRTCQKMTYNNASGAARDTFLQRELITFQNVLPSITLSGAQTVLVRYIRVWLCSSWQASGLTQISTTAQACLNSAAAVTGALAGPP